MEKYSYYDYNKISNYISPHINNNHFIFMNKSKNKRDEEDLKKITENLKEERKKNKELKAENDKIIEDIISVRTNIKSLIPSLPQNKQFPFPTFENLIEQIRFYLNLEALKYYQRLQLKNQFPLDIILLHFKFILQKSQELIQSHFSNIDFLLNKKFKSPELTKPIQCVLKNAYQIDWKNIYNKISTEEKLNKMIIEIKQYVSLKLNKKLKNSKNSNSNNLSNIINFSSTAYLNHLKDFIKLTIEIILKCHINLPKICFDLTKIGRLEKFNPSIHECLVNEKIIRGCEVLVVCPAFYFTQGKSKKTICKDKVVLNGIIDSSIISFGFGNTINMLNNKNNLGHNFFDKKISESQEENESYYYNRNKYNEIIFGFKGNNNNRINNSSINNNKKNFYFQPEGDNGEENLLDCDGDEFYKK